MSSFCLFAPFFAKKTLLTMSIFTAYERLPQGRSRFPPVAGETPSQRIRPFLLYHNDRSACHTQRHLKMLTTGKKRYPKFWPQLSLFMTRGTVCQNWKAYHFKCYFSSVYRMDTQSENFFSWKQLLFSKASIFLKLIIIVIIIIII